MTIKELEREIKRLKQELKEQNNKWNKILAAASVVSALAAVLNLIITWLNYKK
jgi:CHASE3 domain sensor protein